MGNNESLVARFESLGDNCEFGFVQRRSGVEDGGLLRWAVSPPEALLKAIRSRFSGVYKFENIIPFSRGMVNDTKSGFKFHSKLTSTNGLFDDNEERRREIHKVEYEKISYLCEKLNESLARGEKTFIYKKNSGIPDSLIEQLSAAIAECGPSRLLYVKSDADRAGTVELVNDSLSFGYVEHFAPYASANEMAYDSWLKMLKSYQA